jgi:hypothetical protein
MLLRICFTLWRRHCTQGHKGKGASAAHSLRRGLSCVLPHLWPRPAHRLQAALHRVLHARCLALVDHAAMRHFGHKCQLLGQQLYAGAVCLDGLELFRCLRSSGH